MTLSEAIKLGATLRPQAFGGLFKTPIHSVEGIGSCALGAAYEATFGKTQPAARQFDVYAALSDQYPLLDAPARCAECGLERTVEGVISHLNDVHFYTREAIAAWVATQEAR
jgi:hypothetical protein